MERSREDEVRERLADIAGDDPGPGERALLGRLIRSFLDKNPGGVDRLAELLRGGDPAALREQAHALKGSATNIGADSLARVFAEIEHSAREGVVPDPDLMLGRVAGEQALVYPVLEKIAAEGD
ncbi:Hpt domain-containing protein [Paractinoplanes lichenicola]|uniref:Hpt domain-containing protein n=1 Tax=Paractinoplanes lichenicola TaxID=2802976 RepID=A0ABS1VV30_9ACTN|nr:Hpt domain-containing protein [Actinoplanes lichenicola]MBL7258315.1 Hpt domain-containing protein [Actinoplanes lichenicola]